MFQCLSIFMFNLRASPCSQCLRGFKEISIHQRINYICDLAICKSEIENYLRKQHNIKWLQILFILIINYFMLFGRYKRVPLPP